MRQLLAGFGLLALIFGFPTTGQAALTIEPSTWNVIGLDSNSQSTGPYRFPVGAKLCGGTPGVSTTATFHWDRTNPYVNLRGTPEGTPLSITYGPSGCADAFFEVEVDRVSAAFSSSTNLPARYYIASNGLSTPRPRELIVERLVSQSRNAITNMEFGTSLASLTSVPNGGSFDLTIGSTYYIRMSGFTATQGYEQLESFVNFPNTIFQILSVSSTYSADTSAIVSSPNDKLYADSCGWDNDPNSPSYLSCYSDGKAGGTVQVTYQVKIVATAGSRETLSSLIHDFSGSSFHYNADFSTSARFANIVDPTAVMISKNFSPDPNNVNGISSLTFTLSNPNTGALSGVSFADIFPAQPMAPGDMTLANTSTTNTCGGTLTDSGGGALNAGDTGIRLANATVPANGSCSVVVNITTSSTTPVGNPYSNITGHVFVGAIDTGKFATDTLTVNTDPPAGTGVCGDSMASWTFRNGFDITNPAPTTNNIVTATARPGTGTAPIGITPIAGASRTADGTQSWGSNGNIDATNGVLTTTQKDYFEFRLNTTGYTKAYISFYARRTNNGPVGIAVYSSNQSDQVNEPYAAIYNNATALGTGWPATPFGAYEIPLRGNDTYVRIYAYDSANTNTSSDVYIDDVVFTGCKLPNQPTIAKAFSPSPIASGATSTLTFTLTNPNAVALNGATFTDTFPAGMTVSSPLNANTTCVGGTLQDDAGGVLAATDPGIRLTGGTIPASSSCQVTVNVTAATGATTGVYSNTSGFLSTTEGGQNKNSIATATLTVLAPPAIVKAFAPDPIFTGGTTTLTFTLSNPNAGTALNGVAFSDTFPVAPGVMTLANTTTTNTCGGVLADNSGGALNIGDSGIRLTGGTIAANSTCIVTVDVTAPSAGTYSNTSGNVSHILNGTWNGNTASDTLTVETPNPAIALLKQVAPTGTGPWSSYLAVASGGSVYYRFTVENLGDVSLNPFSVSDPGLPAPLSLASCTWKDGDGNTLTAPLTLPVADADNGHIATCILGPATAANGTHPNTATASGSFGATTVTDTSTATYATSALTLTKTADKSFYLAAGETINYSYVISNTGAAVLTGPITVTVSDNLIATVTCPVFVGDFDPGESVTCTASYTVSASDVSDRQVTNLARGTVSGVNITTQYTPQVSRTVPLGPDLSVVKSNSVGGNANTNTPFDWTLTVTNSASAGPAAFSNGQVLLRDDLPAAGMTYSVPAVATNAGGTAGVVSCAIAASTLTCTANGAVTMPSGGSFSIDVITTASAAGVYANPRGGGVCRVDPGNLAVEINDESKGTDNNACTNTVTVTTPAITLIKIADKSYFTAAGEVISYTYKVRNTGANILGSVGPPVIPVVITISDDKVAVTCPPITAATPGGNNDFETNEELTCNSTAPYTVLAADFTAREVTNLATATVTPGAGPAVLSPQVSLTVPIGPDLSVVKTHPAATPIPGIPFDWTLTVTNAATAGYPANFTNGQVLLQDDLPDSGATYNLPLTAATLIGTATGTINCSIAASTLTCSASGNVSIPPGSGFSIDVPTTAASGGTLTNPRPGPPAGICRVDPGALVAEIDETPASNDCSDAVLVGTPIITVLKSVQAYWDPVSLFNKPKAIPGALMLYTLQVTNTGYGPTDAGTVKITDPLPAGVELYVGDLDGAGSGPVRFTDGAVPSGLSYSFGGLADPADKLAFSSDGSDYGYTPNPDPVTGFDPNARYFRVIFDDPADIFGGSDGTDHPSFTLQFRVRVK